MRPRDLDVIARRLCRMERVLGSRAREDAARAALVAIGAVALAHAERRAGIQPPFAWRKGNTAPELARSGRRRGEIDPLEPIVARGPAGKG